VAWRAPADVAKTTAGDIARGEGKSAAVAFDMALGDDHDAQPFQGERGMPFMLVQISR
jgi:hypothetical protein